MTEPERTNEEDGDEDAAVRNLLKRSLSSKALGHGEPSLLQGVQRRIRHRSRGKFFGDGWSTTHARVGYVLVALMTLLVVGLAYLAMGPMDIR